MMNMNSTKGTTNMRFFHVSSEELDQVTFFPRVPKNTLTNSGNEEGTIARVCFAPTVDQCLMAMCNEYGVYNIYEPVDYGVLTVVNNTKKFVPDYIYTNEIWTVTETKFKKLGSIYVYGYPDWEGEFLLKNKVNGRYTGKVVSWYWKNIS
jgi:hypothetical protein